MIKCSFCKKKTLILISCRCGKDFCSKHKDPEIHKCNFDYKKLGRDKIEKENPKVVTDKIKNRLT